MTKIKNFPTKSELTAPQSSEKQFELLDPEGNPDGKFKLYLENVKNYGKVTVHMHDTNKRCTILFENQGWLTFQLQEKSKQIIKHVEHKDAVLHLQDGKLFVLSDFQKFNNQGVSKENTSRKSYEKWIFTCYQPDEIVSRNFKIKMPYDIQQGLFCLSVLSLDLSQVICSAVLFYKSKVTQQINVCQVTTTKSNEDPVDTRELEKLPKLLASKIDYHISYPILMYKTPHPMGNFLHVVNLAVNKSQLRLNIYPYQFVQFVQTGIINDSMFKTKSQTVVYFLARHVEIQTFRLMYFKSDPWQLSDQPEQQNSVQLVSGSLEMPKCDSQLNRVEVILLQRQTKIGLKMALLIQYECNKNSIWCCHFGQGKQAEQVVTDPTQRVLPLKMQPGPNNTCFFIQEDSDASQRYQIVKVSLVDHKSKKTDKKSFLQTIVHFQRSMILAWQIRQDKIIQDISDHQTQILIFDEDKVYTKLGEIKAKFKVHAGNTQQLQILSKVDLSERGVIIENLCAQFYQEQYPKAILGDRMIGIPRHTDYISNNLVLANITFMLYSDTTFKTNYLLYLADKAIKEQKAKKDLNQFCAVLDLQHVNLIGKHFAVVKEDKISYFETYKSPEIRRIDFMDYQQQIDCIRQIKVINKVVAVEVQGYSLTFDQKTQLLTGQKQEMSKSRVIKQNQGQDQFVVHKLGSLKSLYQYCSDGSRALVCSNYKKQIKQNTDELIEELKKFQNTQKQVRINTDYTYDVDSASQRPDCTVSSEGKIVQAFVAFKQKIQKKIEGTAQETNNNKSKEKEKEKEKQNRDPQSLKIHVVKKVSFSPEQQNVEVNRKYQLVSYLVAGDDLQAIFELSQSNETEYRKKLSVHMTQKYLVLIFLDVILIASLYDIDQAQKDNFQNLWEPEKIPVKVIEIRQYFDSDTINRGFHVSVVDQDQLIKFSNYKPTELIQISTEASLMVWDLDKLEEIWCVKGYDQFNSSENNFVRIGSNSLVPRRIVEKQQILKIVTKNSESTVFCIPKIPNQQIGSCFTLYSALDVHEWQFIQIQFQQQRLVKRVDDQAVTADIQGMSIFQFFKDEPDLFTLIREKIESKQLEQICTIDGMMFDHIYIRQIFYLLQLPLFGEKTANKRSILSKIHHNIDIVLLMQERVKEKLNEYRRKSREGNIWKTSEKKTNTIIQSCIKSKTDVNTKLLEPLLELLLLSSECSLTNVVTDLQSLKCLLNLDSPAIQDFFQKSFIETQMTANISDIEMDYLLGQDNYLSFEGNSSQYSEQYIMKRLESVKADQFDHFTSLKILKCLCKTRINKQEQNRNSNWFDRWLEPIQNQNKIADALFNFFRKRLYIQKLKQVKIRIVEVDWVKQEGFNLIYYLAALNSREEEKFFDNELIRMLMRHKFKDESMQWVLKCTYIVYMALTLWYLTYWVTFSFQPDKTDDYENIKTLSLAFFICIMILTVYLFTVEMKQILRAGRLPSVWNFLHLFNYLFNAAILITDVSLRTQDQQDQQMNIDLVFCASFSSFLLWANLYHIVQTFTGMSFYVHLIFEAVKDSILFLVILFIGVFMFSNAILIFDFALKYYPCDGADFEHQGLIPEQSDSDIFDSILNMYQMTQGNFDTDNYNGIGLGIAFGRYNYVRGFIWAVYIIATFFLVITLLNVLIAIINETYNNVMQNRQRYDLMQRTIGLADFRLFPSVKKAKQFGQRYLYFLDPVDLNEEKNQSVYSNFSKLKQMIAKGNYIQSQLSTEATTNKSEVRQIQRKLDDIDEKFNQPKGTQGGTQDSQQLKNISEKLDSKVGQLQKNLDLKVEEIQSRIDQKNSMLEKTIKSEVTAVQSEISEISELNKELARKVQGIESGISMLQQTMVSMLREMNGRI